jgi:hypothetical protein
MKKILIILMLFLTSSFARDIIQEQRAAAKLAQELYGPNPVQKQKAMEKATQELYASIMSGLVCDASKIEKLIKEGADVNYLKYGKPADSLYTMVAERKRPSCDKAAELLKSAGAKSREQLQVEWDAKHPKEDPKIQLNKNLVSAIETCRIDNVKQAIEQGADKNAVFDATTNETVFAKAAGYGIPNCAAIAQYLNSVGADSIGIKWNSLKSYIYAQPKVFDDKNLKLIIENVDIDGGSEIKFENKESEPVYIYSILVKVNEYELLNDYSKKPKVVDGRLGLNSNYQWFTPIEKKEQYPKIINNKTAFKRQITVSYKYKGKTYELKTPLMSEAYEVVYTDVTPFSGLININQ